MKNGKKYLLVTAKTTQTKNYLQSEYSEFEQIASWFLKVYVLIFLPSLNKTKCVVLHYDITLI